MNLNSACRVDKKTVQFKILIRTFLLIDTLMIKFKKLFRFLEMILNLQKIFGLKNNQTYTVRPILVTTASRLLVRNHLISFKKYTARLSSNLIHTK